MSIEPPQPSADQGGPRLSFSINPVVLKEMRTRMRGNRAFMILTIYLTLAALLIIGIYGAFLLSDQNLDTASNRQGLGKLLFGATAWMQLMVISFTAPALTSGSIVGEREHQTYDLLRTTLLPARSLVWGKFGSALLFLLEMLVAALPAQSIAFLFGGVSFREVLGSSVLLVVTAVIFCASGVYLSSLAQRITTATLLAYAFVLLLVLGLPLFILFGLALFNSVIDRILRGSWLSSLLGGLFGYLLLCTNPLSTAVLSEVALLDQGRFLVYTLSLSGGRMLYMPSPWIVYSLFYLLLSLVLLFLAVRRVERPER